MRSRILRYTAVVLVLGLMALGAGTAWSAHEVRQLRLARLLQEELHENQILRARQAALLDRAFELAKRVDEEAVRLGGDFRAASSATEEMCRETEAAGVSNLGEPSLSSTTGALAHVRPPRCAAITRLQPAAQLRAAL